VSGAPGTRGDGRGTARRRRAEDVDASATVRRLAVLLTAGVAPAAAWGHVSEAAGHPVVVALGRACAEAAAEGRPLAEALGAAAPPGAAGTPWRGLAAAWAVAERCGAPLAPSLDRFADALRDLHDARRDVVVALAGPRSSARVVLALPPLGLVLSLALGFDVGHVLLGTAPGWGCLAVAAGLVLGARRWTRRLVRRAEPEDPLPGLYLEVVAVALAGGAAWDGALVTARTCWLEHVGGGDEAPADEGEATAALDLARRAGAPAAVLLRAAAEERRRDARAAARAAAERLGVQLVLPLGVCVLPAFVVVAVVPLVLSLLSSTDWA